MERVYAPRRLDLANLVRELVDEHQVMKRGLQQARDSANRGDFEGVRRVLVELDPVFRQHIADEEAQVLGLLIERLGVKGAESEIRVFRQHRPIYRLMRKVGELAAMPSADLETNQAALQKLFDEHTSAEEGCVFPRAMSLREKGNLAGAGL